MSIESQWAAPVGPAEPVRADGGYGGHGGDAEVEHASGQDLEDQDDHALPEPPLTGDDAVDRAVAEVAQAVIRPLEDQVAVIDAAHRTLQDRLADVEG